MSAAFALALAVLAAGTFVPAAAAQDFAPASPAGPADGAAALLERALPAPLAPFSLEGVAVRWLALPQLETRALALLVPAGSMRAAAGLSQTGDPELGWTCAALAIGAAAGGAGFGLRAAARRDRIAGALRTSGAASGLGAEAGAGGWLAAAPGVTVWAQAPQLWRAGEAPPLERPLELGARLDAGALSAWLALGAARAADGGARTMGLALSRGALSVWAEGRDGPARGAVGVAADAGPLRVAARIEGHPALGETSRLSLSLRRGPSGSAP